MKTFNDNNDNNKINENIKNIKCKYFNSNKDFKIFNKINIFLDKYVFILKWFYDYIVIICFILKY